MTEFVKKKYGVNSDQYNYLILYTGYKMNDNDQLNKILDITKWPEVWKFNDVIFESQSGRYCNYETIKSLNPVSRVKGIYNADKILLKTLFDDFLKDYNIDGIMRKPVKTTIELYGLTDEEIIIKGDMFEKKLLFDTAHPSYWGNWKINNFTLPPNGINMNVALEFKNNHFQILKFYINNNTNTTDPIISKPNHISLLTYNVHGWANINGDINKIKNYYNIMDFIKQSNCDIVLLQEVDIKSIKTNEIVQKMKSFGYIDNIYGPNGTPLKRDQNSYIMAFAKHTFQNKRVVDLSVWKYKRNCLLFTYQNIKFAGIHLEIGEPYDYVNKNSDTAKQIIIKNANYRKDQLNKLLDNNILFGDFNFDVRDEECSWLRKEKKFGLVDDKNTTNPFNTRTDMVFINLESKIVATLTKTLKYNYSDHLPVITTIKKIEI
jgi:endonuclease/exonuclease/phosphatase family metal-dependent hydrolase